MPSQLTGRFLRAGSVGVGSDAKLGRSLLLLLPSVRDGWVGVSDFRGRCKKGWAVQKVLLAIPLGGP
jgi:hypothetical protein